MDFFYDHMCFACGKQNPYGLHLQFAFQDEKIVAQFIPEERHQGYPGIMHGGLITTILDELMAKAVNVQGWYGVTARLEMRFREQVPVGEKLTFEAWIIKQRKKVVDLESRAVLNNGKIACEAKARFMILGKIE